MKPISYTTLDNLTIRGVGFGVSTNPIILLLHGGGQSCLSWNDTAHTLAQNNFYAIAMDLRGHGDSDWSPTKHYDLDHYVSDLEIILKSLNRPVVLVGASLGGLISLLVAGECQSTQVKALVLVDIVPQMEDKGFERILTFLEAHLGGFDSLEQASDAIARYLKHRKYPPTLERLGSILNKSTDGRYYWRWDPALVTADKFRNVRDEPLYIKAAHNITVPTLLLHGVFSDIVSPNVVQQFLQIIPHAQCVAVDDAAHTVAGDSNMLFTQELLKFLRS